MNSKKLSWFWLGSLLAVALFFAAVHGSFPENMAVHFDASGNANGYQTQGAFTLSFLMVVLVQNCLFAALFFKIGTVPLVKMRVPNREQWLSKPDGTAVFLERLRIVFALLGFFCNFAYLFALQVIYQQNVPNPGFRVSINAGLVFVLVGSACLVVLVWVLLRKPPQNPQG